MEKKNDPKRISEETNLENLQSFTKEGLAGHQWVQRGPYIVCTSCPVEHGLYVGTGKVMVGYNEDGTPKFEDVKIDERS